MKISKELLNEIIMKLPSELPETGGIIGGNSDVVTEYWIEIPKEKVDGFMCCYIPDVDKINEMIQEWAKKGVEFMGMFHTHYFGVDTLSEGDISYIKEILAAMPDGISKLYFPIFIFPDGRMVLYVADKQKKDVYKEEYVQF